MMALPILLALAAVACLAVAVVLAVRRPLAPGPRTKVWRRSKTLWLNVATIVAAGVAIVEASTGDWKAELQPWGYYLLVVALAMANAALRLITTKGLTTDPDDQ